MEVLASELGGSLQNGRIICPENLLEGEIFGYQINQDISVLFQHVTYYNDIHYQMRNDQVDFVGIYFNLTEGDLIQVTDKVKRPLGRWAYNLAVMDSVLPCDYFVKSDSTIFSISIFIKKTALIKNLERIPNFNMIKDLLFDENQNTLIRFERMTNQAWFLMNELRKTSFESALFNTYLTGTVYGLLADYLDQILEQEVVLETVSQDDVAGIISSQSTLIDGMRGLFPGIETLASAVNMSESKYKQLFKKNYRRYGKRFFSNQ